jgi:hypothetical protein
MNFFKEHSLDDLEKRWNTFKHPDATRPATARAIFLDSTIEQMPKLFGASAVDRKLNGEYGPGLVVGNEGGAPLAVQIALKMKGEDILEKWVDGEYNPSKLIFGRSKAKKAAKKMNPLKDSEAHKGSRLMKATDALINKALGRKSETPITMEDFAAKSNTAKLAFNVFNLTKNELMFITSENYPDMPVSLAMLASMAGSPTFVDVEFGEEKFCSGSKINPYPLDAVAKLYKEINKNGTEDDFRFFLGEPAKMEPVESSKDLVFDRPAFPKNSMIPWLSGKIVRH